LGRSCSADERLAVHPRATHAGQRFTLPGQRQGLERGSYVLNIRGESYRLREKKRAGLFSSPLVPMEGGKPTTDSVEPAGRCHDCNIVGWSLNL